MKPVFYILSTVVCVVLAGVVINPAINAISGSQAFAADDVVGVAEAQSTQKDALSSEEDAVLGKLRSLLSEDYCPNDEAKDWDWNVEKAAPACLLEQANKIRLAVFGPSEFSDEEERKLRELVASAKEAQAKLKEFGCKPGEVKKWTDGGQVDAPPECMQTEARIVQEHNRKNGMGAGQTLIQDYVLDTKIKHLEDMDKLNYLLAQVLYQYSCEADMNASKDCVLNFYNSIRSKW
ncbi:MAG: hypothetical protein KDI61_07850 [Alphaproteobacteria bacterium]|nr:hypothetical protein [Alphaproteobacteria bacterium]